jgi:hypothetical protein
MPPVVGKHQNALMRTDRTDWKEGRSETRGGGRASCEERIEEKWWSPLRRERMNQEDAETVEEMWRDEHG